MQVLILSEKQPYLCVLVSLLCCAFRLGSWIRKCHDNWLLHDLSNKHSISCDGISTSNLEVIELNHGIILTKLIGERERERGSGGSSVLFMFAIKIEGL